MPDHGDGLDDIAEPDDPSELDELDPEITAQTVVSGVDDEELFGAEPDETSFDHTRTDYTGATEEGEEVSDQEEWEEAGADLDDPERMAVLEGGMDDPDGTDGWT